MSRPYIVPALIPTDQSAVVAACAQLAFVSELHLDVVDGSFVSAVSWPYDPMGDPVSVMREVARFSLEVDLMVADPLLAAKAWLAAGADRLVFHVETISVAELRRFDAATNCSIGIAASNDTSVETLLTYAPYADYVQIMGIAEIGQQGQPLDERVFTRIRAFQTMCPTLPITVDGSVNASTIARLAKTGVERLIVGSAIVKTADPEQAYNQLQTLLR